LIEAGYRVSEWSRARPLLEAMQRGELEPDLAIVDQELPDLAGEGCLAGIRQLGCSAPLLLMTGGTECVSTFARAVLRKPFSIAELRHAVREAITAGAMR